MCICELLWKVPVSLGVQIVLPTAIEVMEGEELELCVVIYIPPERLEREVNLTFDLVPISPYAGNQPYWYILKFLQIPLNS